MHKQQTEKLKSIKNRAGIMSYIEYWCDFRAAILSKISSNGCFECRISGLAGANSIKQSSEYTIWTLIFQMQLVLGAWR